MLILMSTHDRGSLWRLDWKTVGLDWSASASGIGLLVLTLDTGFLRDRHI